VPGIGPSVEGGTVPPVAPFALYVYVGLKIANKVALPVLVYEAPAATCVPVPSAAVFQPTKLNPVLVNPDPELTLKVLLASVIVVTAAGTVPVAPFVL
jgi:hypothetical protein